jgi:hypothetical protein
LAVVIGHVINAPPENPAGQEYSFPYADVRRSLAAGKTARGLIAQLRAFASEVFVHFGNANVLSLGTVFDTYTDVINRSRRTNDGGRSLLARLGGGFDYDLTELNALDAADRSRHAAPGTSTSGAPAAGSAAAGAAMLSAKLTMLVQEADQQLRWVLASGEIRMGLFSEANTLINSTVLAKLRDGMRQDVARERKTQDIALGVQRQMARRGLLRRGRSVFLSDPAARVVLSARGQPSKLLRIERLRGAGVTTRIVNGRESWDLCTNGVLLPRIVTKVRPRGGHLQFNAGRLGRMARAIGVKSKIGQVFLSTLTVEDLPGTRGRVITPRQATELRRKAVAVCRLEYTFEHFVRGGLSEDLAEMRAQLRNIVTQTIENSDLLEGNRIVADRNTSTASGLQGDLSDHQDDSQDGSDTEDEMSDIQDVMSDIQGEDEDRPDNDGDDSEMDVDGPPEAGPPPRVDVDAALKAFLDGTNFEFDGFGKESSSDVDLASTLEDGFPGSSMNVPVWRVRLFMRHVLGGARGELDEAMDQALGELLQVDPQAEALASRFGRRWNELAKQARQLAGPTAPVPEHLIEAAQQLIQEVHNERLRLDRAPISPAPNGLPHRAVDWFASAEAVFLSAAPIQPGTEPVPATLDAPEFPGPESS